MNTATSRAACIALALGAHAALLLPKAPTDGGHAAARGAAMRVRVQLEAGAVPSAAEPARQPAADATITALAPSPPAPAPSQLEASPGNDEPAPRFEGGLPDIGFPDAPLPESGAEVRAYVLLDATGSPQSITTAATPGLPAGFQKRAELGLRQARFQVDGPAAYCLLVRFTSEAPTAALSWLPGAASDPTRCLSGPRPAPREISAEAP